MPKHTIEFNLPEEEEELRITMNASRYLAIIFGLNEWLRSEIKYQELPEETKDTYQKVREKIGDLADEHEVEIF